MPMLQKKNLWLAPAPIIAINAPMSWNICMPLNFVRPNSTKLIHLYAPIHFNILVCTPIKKYINICMPLVYFYVPNSNFRFLSSRRGGWWGWLMFDKNQPIYMMWKGVFIFTTCPPLFVDSNPLYPQKCENLFFDSYYNAQNHHIGNILYFNLYKYLHKIIKLAWNFQRHIPHIHLATLKVETVGGVRTPPNDSGPNWNYLFNF